MGNGGAGVTYQLPAQLIHDIISDLPTRLKKRADALTQDAQTWTISDAPLTITIGTNTVTFSENELACDCLLSPKCAHCGAVALAAEVADDTPIAATTPDSKPQEETVPALSTSEQQAALRTASDLIQPVLTELITYGLPALSPLSYAQLVAAVHHARTHKLYRLERALTAVVTVRNRIRGGNQRTGPRRQAITQAFGNLLQIAHLISHQPDNPATIGVARRSYTELTPGRDDGTFTPIFAEPVVTDSGFAGVVVTLADKTGKLYTVGKTPPGTLNDVAKVWHGPVRLGDINTSFTELSTRTVIISGGSASTDGRIGSGKNIRAAQGRAVTCGDVATIPGVDTVTGAPSYADLAKISFGPGSDYFFSRTATQCGVAGLVADVLDAETITLIVHDRLIKAVWIDETRLIPGLDRRGADIAVVSPNKELGYIDPSPTTVVYSWLQRIALQGQSGVHHEQLKTDRAQLRAMNAPTGAELLDRISSHYTIPHITALAFYCLGN